MESLIYILQIICFSVGPIDQAHHDGKAVKAIYDTIELDNTIHKSIDLVNEADTRIVVTADL